MPCWILVKAEIRMRIGMSSKYLICGPVWMPKVGRAAIRGQMAWRAIFLLMVAPVPISVSAQVAISDSGTATYNYEFTTPPGVGLTPNLSLSYAAGSGNGPVGVGWSLQGLSVVTRCPATLAIDQKTAGVVNGPLDKLCLDGLRLIQTDESGNPSATSNASGVAVATQTNDAGGLASSQYREFRTEKDIYARIRAYGYANGDTTGASGPAYFKVWHKSGQIYEYGSTTSGDANTNALITRYASSGSGTPMVWAIARKSDNFGNYIDYKYEQRNVSWGSGIVTDTPTPGREWALSEIQYSGNKIIFNYWVDASGKDQRTDRSEAYQLGSKNVSSRLLKSITSYINSPNTASLGATSAAVAVKTLTLSYDNGPNTSRSRLTKFQECAGATGSTRCKPATEFTYTSGGGLSYEINQNFKNDTSAIATTVLQKSDGTIGVVPLDIDGDGKTDLLRIGDDPANNQLWLSNGDGTFRSVAKGTGAGQFNISINLTHSNGCYSAFIADVNGDGLPDIIRYAGTTTPAGVTCTTTDKNAYIFINNGDGSFVQTTLSGVTLKIKTGSAIVGGCTSWCSQPPYGLNQGFTFYLLDLNGDGKVDIVTAESPAVPVSGTASTCTGCSYTHVYFGDGTGAFNEVTTNVAGLNLYTLNEPRGSISARDIDGDGMLDLFTTRLSVVNNATPTVVQNAWRSRGDGNFDQITFPASASCNVPIDFNGDGRADCLGFSTTGVASNKLQVATSASAMQAVAGFNLVSTGQEFIAAAGGVGIQILDINGDGRQDILRWKDASSGNALYLSKGDGTFTTTGTEFLTSIQLRQSNGNFNFVLGDFTGRGTYEILRTSTNPIAGDATSNLLLTKADATPPDILTSVKSGTGIVTSLYYVPLANSKPNNGVSADLGCRYSSDRYNGANADPGCPYSSDRGNSTYAVANAQNQTPPFYVVATSVTDAGVGSAKIATEYSYAGFKSDLRGRGALGFREIRRQTPAPNGEPLTTVAQAMQVHPYTGMAANTKTYRGPLNTTGSSQLLGSQSNVFCDQTNNSAASATTHCPVTALIARPYVYQSISTGTELDGSALPQVITTISQFTDTGDVRQVQSATTGTGAGVTQSFSKTVTNIFDVSNTACSNIFNCSWVLGRVIQTTVASSVPTDLLPVSPGTSSNATATSGATASAVSSPMSPAILSAILELLLDD